MSRWIRNQQRSPIRNRLDQLRSRRSSNELCWALGWEAQGCPQMNIAQLSCHLTNREHLRRYVYWTHAVLMYFCMACKSIPARCLNLGRRTTHLRHCTILYVMRHKCGLDSVLRLSLSYRPGSMTRTCLTVSDGRSFCVRNTLLICACCSRFYANGSSEYVCQIGFRPLIVHRSELEPIHGTLEHPRILASKIVSCFRVTNP